MRVVIVGGGKTAYFVGKRFLAKNFHVTLITPDRLEAHAFALDLTARILHGDGTTPLMLRDAEADRADALIALMPRDEDNMVTCLVAQRLFAVPQVIAMVNDPGNTELFQRLGVAGTFSTAELMTRLIEEKTSSAGLMAMLPLAGGRAQVTEVILPPGTPADGAALQDLGLPEGALVAMVIRDEAVSVPGGGVVLRAGDRLLLISQPENYGPLLRALLGKAS